MELNDYRSGTTLPADMACWLGKARATLALMINQVRLETLRSLCYS